MALGTSKYYRFFFKGDHEPLDVEHQGVGDWGIRRWPNVRSGTRNFGTQSEEFFTTDGFNIKAAATAILHADSAGGTGYPPAADVRRSFLPLTSLAGMARLSIRHVITAPTRRTVTPFRVYFKNSSHTLDVVAQEWVIVHTQTKPLLNVPGSHIFREPMVQFINYAGALEIGDIDTGVALDPLAASLSLYVDSDTDQLLSPATYLPWAHILAIVAHNDISDGNGPGASIWQPQTL